MRSIRLPICRLGRGRWRNKRGRADGANESRRGAAAKDAGSRRAAARQAKNRHRLAQYQRDVAAVPPRAVPLDGAGYAGALARRSAQPVFLASVWRADRSGARDSGAPRRRGRRAVNPLLCRSGRYRHAARSGDHYRFRARASVRRARCARMDAARARARVHACTTGAGATPRNARRRFIRRCACSARRY